LALCKTNRTTTIKSNYQQVTNQTKQPTRKNGKAMKHIFTGFNLVGAFALLALAVGCASYQVRTTESLLSEAGFQTRTPSTPAQLAMYNQMTPYKVERNTFKGKALYSYADKQKGVAYIGGEKAYQRYKQLAAQQYQMEANYSKMLAHEDQVWSVNYD
jgi:hypothetical protein